MISRSPFVRFSAVLAVLLVPLVGSAQELAPLHTHGAYVVRQVNGNVRCDDASPAEAERINARPAVPLRVFGESNDKVRANASAGLNIILRGTAQLDANPQAKAAFERAADIWESRIADQITVFVDVDFGSQRFGQPFPDPNTIASASSDYRGGSDGVYGLIRPLLVSHANNAAETAVYNALPASTLPTDLGTTTKLASPSILLRALGAIAGTAPADDSAPSIGFNNAFPYDFDPSNGISPGQTDFEAVVVHEIGHMLGFVSLVGISELDNTQAFIPTILDLFRFRPGVNGSNFTSRQRILSSGGDHVYFANNVTLAFSTGRTDGTGGDERQASHWKDDALTGSRIGIMDPTLSSGTRSQITENDLTAFAMIGFNIVAPNTATPPAAPTNLTATATSSSVIRLNWVDNSSDETEFRVEQKVGANFVDIGAAAANSTTINVTGFAPSTTGTFRVRARSGAGDSAYTNEASATTFGSGPSACTPTNTVVCLLSNRFRVSIDYINAFANPPQPGQFVGAKLLAGTQNPDVATFGISGAQAIEVVVRIQDARPFGVNRFDIYYGGLTDLEYTVTVTDTTTGTTRTYRNAPGTVGGGVDRTSFPGVLSGEDRITSGGHDTFIGELTALLGPMQTLSVPLTKAEARKLQPAVQEALVTRADMTLVPHNVGGGGACAEVEPNQGTSTASTLPFNDPCTGFVDLLNVGNITVTIGADSDNIEDVFKVTLPAQAQLNVQLAFTNAVADLDLFLFRIVGSDLEGLGSSRGETTTEAITTATLPAGTYFIGVSAYSGQSNYTLTASPIGLALTPAAPTNLTATTLSSNQIRIAWTDNATDETGYIVEARLGTGAYQQVGSTAAPANTIAATITINNPVAGGTYTFRVKARNAAGDSGYSNEASATLPGGNSGTCTTSPTVTCLLNGRFRVSIAFINAFANPPQPGDFLGAKLVAGSQNPDVATFGISSAQAIEAVVRIQDTRPFGLNRFDVYYGGLTDLEYTVRITDVQTGVTREYRNEPGNVGGGVDRQSFTAN